MLVDFKGERTTGDWFVHWKKHYYRLWTSILTRSNSLKLNVLRIDLLLIDMQFFTLQDINWWTRVVCLLVDYCNVFLSAVWALILTAPIHCRWSIGEWCYISPYLVKKQTPLHLWMAWGWMHFQQIQFSFKTFSSERLTILLNFFANRKRKLKILRDKSSNIWSHCWTRNNRYRKTFNHWSTKIVLKRT